MAALRNAHYAGALVALQVGLRAQALGRPAALACGYQQQHESCAAGRPQPQPGLSRRSCSSGRGSQRARSGMVRRAPLPPISCPHLPSRPPQFVFLAVVAGVTSTKLDTSQGCYLNLLGGSVCE
jgi:hypothetical protein